MGDVKHKKTLEIQKDEHAVIGGAAAKKVFVLDDAANIITQFGSSTVVVEQIARSFYQDISLVSGYNFYGFTEPGSNPTTATFRLQREARLEGEVLFGDGTPTFKHQWSSASMPSISYT